MVNKHLSEDQSRLLGPALSNKEKLMRMTDLAYNIGVNQESKNNISMSDLEEKVRFFVVRNGYMPMIWAAYKAGRFARKNGDL